MPKDIDKMSSEVTENKQPSWGSEIINTLNSSVYRIFHRTINVIADEVGKLVTNAISISLNKRFSSKDKKK